MLQVVLCFHFSIEISISASIIVCGAFTFPWRDVNVILSTYFTKTANSFAKLTVKITKVFQVTLLFKKDHSITWLKHEQMEPTQGRHLHLPKDYVNLMIIL